MSALTDTDEIFEQMLKYTTCSLCALLNSFNVLPMEGTARNKFINILNENLGDALVCLIITPYEVVAMSKSNDIGDIAPSDIILIQNLIFSSPSLKSTESWVPICLPGISEVGYLQLYSNFVEDYLGIIFITQGQEHDFFMKFSQSSQIIYDSTLKNNLIDPIDIAINKKRFDSSFIRSKSRMTRTTKSISLENSSDVENIGHERILEDLFNKINGENIKANNNNLSNGKGTNEKEFNEEYKYLLCKNKNLNQFFTLKFSHFDKLSKIEKTVMKFYNKLYDIYNSQLIGINSKDFLFYIKEDDFIHAILTTENYILFASFNFFKEFENVNNLMLDIIKNIKAKEADYFINKS